ncbi:MAG TPA: hypothetical protein VN515_05115 [Terriglobales bacterium]|nr:hypothetical protein [Terriglobales bacterium]
MKVLAITVAVTLGVVGLAAQAPGSGGQDNAFFAGPGTHGATLNGQPLLPGTAILQGETVTTGAGGVVVMAPTHGAGGVLELTGNASATVQSGSVQGNSSDQLMVKSGNAMVMGNVSVVTPQGQTFRSATAGTSYVINATAAQSSMGVLTGAVNTYNPRNSPSVTQPPATTIPAGDAIQVAANGGQIQINSIKMAQVNKPAPNAAVPQTVTASQSQ